MYPTNDFFETFSIKFKHHRQFIAATEMNNLADDIGYSDMIMKYSDKFHRDRFAGFLQISNFNIDLID